MKIDSLYETTGSTINFFLSFTRNRAKIVHDCISHLLDSGRSDIEVIVRDNNLTDNTWTTIQKIKDSRLKVYRSPIDQGTFGFMELSKLPSGKIVTWISDEDEFQFEHLDWILSQFSNPECNILFGSIHVGKNGRLIFPEEAIYDQVRASLVELSFSGCDGLFIRNERLHHANFLKCSNVDDGYVLWNNYPIGFLQAVEAYH
ncbi:MAG: glycosyltransferase [Holosporaceae bacterium]|nr:MAG: glycosyltransferase [Holosporaceae bacterium]